MGIVQRLQGPTKQGAIAHFARPIHLRLDQTAGSRRRASRRIMAVASSQLWALDFDGVACDSCGESSLSAWKVRDVYFDISLICTFKY